MSRIDDDREAARVAERLLQQKQRAEQKAAELKTAKSAFARLVEAKHHEQALGQSDAEITQVDSQLDDARAELERAAESGEGLQSKGREAEGRARGRAGQATFGERLRGARVEGEARNAGGQAAELEQRARTDEGRAGDRDTREATAQGRHADAREGKRAQREGEGAGATAGGRRSADADRRTDKDGGGKGDSQDQKGSGDGGGAFRLNPALMAPVPVAQPKPTAGSDRLRTLATEIAEKIVQRVRVGKNAEGIAEFQIDLHSDVLKGLSIKVSGSGGRIKAVFSGRDREILRLLRDQSETLRSALSGRGLTLDELRVEETP